MATLTLIFTLFCDTTLLILISLAVEHVYSLGQPPPEIAHPCTSCHDSYSTANLGQDEIVHHMYLLVFSF